MIRQVTNIYIIDYVIIRGHYHPILAKSSAAIILTE